ncbi:MAG: Lrp/AsnC family transcriptional regulator, partial [Clostridiales bacterium]|nr:Lrp/AsnC family transcriptional regulator [Clostridiales bacterium]
LEHFNLSEQLLKIVNSDPDILECYAITGEYDYILKICAGSINALEDKLLRMKEKGIAKSHTMFALREYKFEPTSQPDFEE